MKSCDDNDHFIGLTYTDGAAHCIYRHFQYDPAELMEFDWCPNCGEPLTEDAKDFIPPVTVEPEEFRFSDEAREAYGKVLAKELEAVALEALKKRAKDHQSRWWKRFVGPG